MGKLKYYIYSIEIFFGLNLLLELYSEFPRFVKTYSFFNSCSFPLYIPNV